MMKTTKQQVAEALQESPRQDNSRLMALMKQERKRAARSQRPKTLRQRAMDRAADELPISFTRRVTSKELGEVSQNFIIQHNVLQRLAAGCDDFFEMLGKKKPQQSNACLTLEVSLSVDENVDQRILCTLDAKGVSHLLKCVSRRLSYLEDIWQLVLEKT